MAIVITPISALRKDELSMVSTSLQNLKKKWNGAVYGKMLEHTGNVTIYYKSLHFMLELYNCSFIHFHLIKLFI